MVTLKSWLNMQNFRLHHRRTEAEAACSQDLQVICVCINVWEAMILRTCLRPPHGIGKESLFLPKALSLPHPPFMMLNVGIQVRPSFTKSLTVVSP